jgi:transcription initiation factor TFIID subunit 1
LKDFELVKTNAMKFNGANSMLANEATAIYDTAKRMVEESRPELSHLEQAVADQMSTQSKKKKTAGRKSASSAAAPGGDDGLLAGISADLNLDFELSDDSDD